MTASRIEPLVQHLRHAVLGREEARLTDGRLLDRFIARRDPAAFEALVRRHGPMVLGVCRRVLRNSHDADDAFQATFLVLARRAASVWPREKVGNWLYGVGHRTALQARAANAKRRSRERHVVRMPEPEAEPCEPGDDLYTLLDEELARLPDKYRLSIALCDLEGRTRREVARQFQIPEGTLSSRLTTARKMLAKRLARRGLAVTGGSLTMVLSHERVSGGVPIGLIRSSVEAALRVVVGQTTGMRVASAQVVALTEGVLRSMLLTKLKAVMAVVLLSMVALGAGVLLLPGVAAQPETPSVPLPADREAPQTHTRQPEAPATPGTEPEPVAPAVADYKALFDRALTVVSDYFPIAYTNRYDGSIETHPLVLKTPAGDESRGPVIRRRANVRITPADDGTFSVEVRVFKEAERRQGSAREEVTWKPIGRDTALEQVILNRVTPKRARADHSPPLVERRARQYELEFMLVQVDRDGKDFGKDGKGMLLAQPYLIVPEGKEACFLSGGQLAVPGDGKAKIIFLDFGISVRARVVGLRDGQVRLEIAFESTRPDRSDEKGVRISGRTIRSVSTVRLGEAVKLTERDDRGEARRWLRVRVVKEESIVSQSRSAGSEATDPPR